MFIDAELLRLREAEYERTRRQIASTAALGPVRAGVIARLGRRVTAAVLGLRWKLARRAQPGVAFVRGVPERVRLMLDPPVKPCPNVLAAPSICVRCFAAVWRDDVAVWTAPQRCVCLRCHQPEMRAVALGSRLHAETAAVLDAVPAEGTRQDGRQRRTPAR